MAAITIGSRIFVGLHPRQGGVSPLAANAISPVVHAAIDGDTPAAAGSEDYREDQFHARARAVGCFGDCEAVGIVRATHFPLQCGAEVAVEGAPVQPRGVGVFYGVGQAGNRAGNSNADGGAALQFSFDGLDAFLDAAHGGVVIVAGSGDAVAMDFAAVALEGYKFDFGAAEVDANAQVRCISYGIPTFRYKGLLFGFAAFTRHCSLFPMRASLIVKYKKDLEGFETAKGTIRFQADKPPSAALIKKLVKARVAQNDAKQKRR